MAKHNFGLVSVEMGTIGGGGTMSTSLSTVGETAIGSATMTTADPTITDFNIEESDSPVESIVTTPGKISFAWSTFNIEPDEMVRFFGGSSGFSSTGPVATFAAPTGGTGYTNGTYTGVDMSGGTGSGAKATVVVSGTVVTAVTITTPGVGYTAGDSLDALAADIGGTGTGFSVLVSTITAATTWTAPDTFVDNELSLQLTDKKGNVVQIPRAKLSAKMNLSFSKTKLAQVDITATVLQPEASGLARIKFIYA
jgi:hypothetical protein